MIVLGRKYRFTQLELERLDKKFKNITIVRYRNRPPEDVLKEIEGSIAKTKSGFDILVLNTKEKVGDDLIRYLTNLQFEKRNKKIQIITIEQFVEKYLHKCYIPEDNNDLHFLTDIKPYGPLGYGLKRMVDYTGAFTLVFFTWPIMIYAQNKIKKESPGPSIFKQPRVGQNNKEFVCVKFRSMHLDAEANGAQFASQNDPRVLQWGELLRKTRIDELPQLLNVLKGDMHLIGPRPERKIWTDTFEQEIPYYAERHIVKPGITGWAQVMYPYGANTEDARQKLMYDLYYIKHWSLWLEMKVIWKTAIVVLKKKGL